MSGHSHSVSARRRPSGSLLVSNPSISLAQDHEQERSTLWNQGCNGVREYVDAGELAQWLHNEPGVNKEYSQKLASRTINALTDLTKGRLYVKQKNRRKDRLSYKERCVVLPDESEISGETTFGESCTSTTSPEMLTNAIGAATSAKDNLEINETDTLDSLTSWAADVLTCLTCGEILPSDTSISGLVECPRCHEVTTGPTKVGDE
ncbi:hypothetical protein [Halalkalicoccus subterraneus]|uniref:hypothetical protein n=1 Tax=Halalkalicoccus subterraneus TaxID=2675002 RepID=UPI001FE58C32|nr:hypothetical protein [Halalkalicoccus subterraneus]